MLGVKNALLVSRLLHVTMIGLLVWLSRAMDLGVVSLIGVAAVTALLVYEHSLVKADDLSRVNSAFFTVNGFVSVLFLVFWAADIAWM